MVRGYREFGFRYVDRPGVLAGSRAAQAEIRPGRSPSVELPRRAG